MDAPEFEKKTKHEGQGERAVMDPWLIEPITGSHHRVAEILDGGIIVEMISADLNSSFFTFDDYDIVAFETGVCRESYGVIEEIALAIASGYVKAADRLRAQTSP